MPERTGNENVKRCGGNKVDVPSKKELWNVLMRVLKFSSPEYLNLSMGTISLYVNSVTNLYFPYAIGKVVDSASRSSGTLSGAELKGPSLFFITGALASFVRVYNFGVLKENSASRLKDALISNLLEQDLDFFDEVGTGELLTTLEKDVNETAEIFADKIPSALRSFNSAVFGSVYLFRVSPYLCLVSLSTIPLVGIIAVVMSKSSSRLTSALRELEKQQSVFVSERLRNMSTVFVNGTQAQERDTFNGLSQSILSQSKKKYFINGVKMSFINIATNASIIAVLYTGASMVGREEISQGDLASFLMRSGFVGLGFSSMASSFSDLRASLSSAARVFTFIDAQKPVASPQPQQQQQQQQQQCQQQQQQQQCQQQEEVEADQDSLSMSSFVDLSPQSGADSPAPLISFRNVKFSYQSRPDQKCLKGLSLDIPARGLTAVAGASGAGKSSMLALMCALYRPQAGELIINGKLMSSCSDDDIKLLRQKIAVVQQSSVLFSGSIAYNIGYGMPNATRADIEDVARMAFSHEFITSMAEGYDTEVGEGGKQLSGGQRQRVALCRALLHDADVLILDEPSSSLDCENESALINLLLSLKRSKCIVVLTHSPPLMAAADSLHLLEGGAIVESGTFSSLKNTDKFKYVLESAKKSMDC